MLQIPIPFPTDRERRRRAIAANQALSYRERIEALDGLWNTVDLFAASTEELSARGRLRRLREEEGHRCIHEFIQRQLAREQQSDSDYS